MSNEPETDPNTPGSEPEGSTEENSRIAFTTEYNVRALKIKDIGSYSKVVLGVVVDLICTTTSGGYQYTYKSYIDFGVNDSDTFDNFIEYANLTETDVITWLQNYINPNENLRDHIQEELQKLVDNYREVTQGLLPWE